MEWREGGGSEGRVGGGRGCGDQVYFSLPSPLLQGDVPTVIGVGPQVDAPMETDKEGSTVGPQRKYYIDNTFIHVPREGVEMASPMKDGMSMSHDVT